MCSECLYFRLDDEQRPTLQACLTDCTYFMQTTDGTRCYDDTTCPGFYRDSDRKRIECLKNADECAFVSVKEYLKCISTCSYSPVVVNGVRYCPDCTDDTIANFTLAMNKDEVTKLESASCIAGSTCNNSLQISVVACANTPACTLNQRIFAEGSKEAGWVWNSSGKCAEKCSESTYQYENQCFDECPAETVVYQQTCVKACPSSMAAKDRVCVTQRLTKSGKILVIIAAVIAGIAIIVGIVIGVMRYKAKKLQKTQLMKRLGKNRSLKGIL